MLDLKRYLMAAYPAVAIETVEERRVVRLVADTFPRHKILTIAADKKVFTWTDDGVKKVRDEVPFHTAFEEYASTPGNVLVVFDYHRFLQDAVSVRRLKQVFPTLKKLGTPGSMLVLVAPQWVFPDELRHEIPVLDMPLPDREQLSQRLTVSLASNPAKDAIPKEVTGKILDSGAGLTAEEAEGVFALSQISVTSDGYKIGVPETGIVLEEKLRLVKQSGFLEVSTPISMNQVGGLGQLKRYVERRIIPTLNDPQLCVRGILLSGLSGCGKSLSTRAISGLLGWPVLSASVSRMKGRLVGESERNMIQTLKTAEAFAPCLIRFDEIEKGIGGYASSAQTDGGTVMGMVGILLTWLAEHTAKVITVMTSNNQKALPSELTNAHRIDECFFVDLPTLGERHEIAAVHLLRLKLPEKYAAYVAELTPDWTAAEIEKLIKETAAIHKRTLSHDNLQETANEMRTYASINAAEVEALRTWGRSNMRLANTPEPPSEAVRVASGKKSVTVN